MNRTRRLVATLVASAALAAPTALVTSVADAKPASKPSHGTKAVKSQVKQLLRDIAVRDRQLARLATSSSVTGLADDTEVVLVGNIEDARASLALLRADVEAADSTFDARAVRTALRAFNVQNFRHAAVVLRQVAELTEAAAADAEAQAFLAEAEAGALALTATSTKAEVRAVKALVAAAEAELAATTVTTTM